MFIKMVNGSQLKIMNIPTKNNNPGDLKDPSTGQFQQFKSPQEGYAALLNDLQAKINNRPDATLADFSNVYAPPSEKDSDLLPGSKI